MRRFLAILLMFMLTLQSVWGAAEPYCQHEQGRAAQHIGHHLHDLVPDDDHAVQAPGHGQQGVDQAQAKSLVDHDHHCCSAWVLLPDMAVIWPAASWPSTLYAEPAHAYRSPYADRIERPNWSTSL